MAQSHLLNNKKEPMLEIRLLVKTDNIVQGADVAPLIEKLRKGFDDIGLELLKCRFEEKEPLG